MRSIQFKTLNFIRLVFAAAAILLVFPAFASARETWTSVRTKNFELIGNAAEPEIRSVARNLEQFREFFRQTFPQLNLNSPVPIRVVVFKDAESYQPFKPVRADGSIDTAVAGYFAGGTDVRYITVSNAGKTAAAFDTIYHEYVHFILNNNIERADLPPWLNEGLAEYFQTFRVENETKIVLGEAKINHLRLLETESLIPFETFLKTDNFAVHNQGNHGRSVFYAESWALAHYLRHSARREQFDKFLDLLLQKKPLNEAFGKSFQVEPAALEKELKNYLAAKQFETKTVTINFPAIEQMQIAAVSEANGETALGDLLLHLNRVDQAAVRLEKAVALDAANASANAALGIARMQQKNFAEAEKYLEKAVRLGSNDFLPPFYYAYVLSRADADPNGYVKYFTLPRAAKMRALLRRSIELNPNFADSYYLLATINVVNEENLNEAVELIEKAKNIDPANLKYELTLGQIRLRQTDYDEAERIAHNVFAAADDKNLRYNAQALLISAQNIREQLKLAAREKLANKNTEYPVISQEEGLLQALNEALRKPQKGERRVLGVLTEIKCAGKSSKLTIRNESTAKETFVFSAPELQKVRMITFAPDLEGRQIGCGFENSEVLAVVTYRPKSEAKSNGEIVSLEFVPKNFRFLP